MHTAVLLKQSIKYQVSKNIITVHGSSNVAAKISQRKKA
jgi:hypothetical protein